MLSVNMPSGRIQEPSDASIIPGTDPALAGTPGAQLDLSTANARIADPTAQVIKPLTDIGTNAVVDATYYIGPNGVVTNPAEPAIPLIAKDVTVAGKALRGVGFRGGQYSDSTVLPLTGAATTEIRGVHAPFVSPVFFPMRLATVNYFDALSGGDTRLLVTPAQHRAIPGSTQSTLRLYSGIDFRLFYSTNIARPALSAAPSISNVTGAVDGTDVVFRASVAGNPAAGVQQVWVTYTGDAPRWESIDLAQCVVTTAQPTLPTGCGTEESTTWIGRLPGAAPNAGLLQFMVQAANGVGLVTLDDNLGAYFTVPAAVTGAPPVAAPTAIVLGTVPGPVTYGGSITATATLSSNGSPVAGRTVVFSLGGGGGVSATTDSTGAASAVLPVNSAPGSANLRASFAEVPGQLLASAVSQPLTINKATTALALDLTTSPIGARATLTDSTGAVLGFRTVYLTVSGVGAPRVLTAITDFLGRATFAPLSLAPGTYSLNAQFLGAVSGSTLTDPTYLGSSDTKPLTVVAVSNVGVSGSAVPDPPVKGSPITYTFVITNAGDTATNVRLTSSLPPSLTSPSTATPGCSIVGSQLSCEFATLANGAVQNVSVTATPTVSGTLETSASVIADGSDPVAINNTAMVSIVVQDPTSPPMNLIVSGPSSIAAGGLYSATANADGAPAPTFSFESTPTRPAWLLIDPASGIVSGQVPATGVTSFSYRVRATNSRGFAVSPTITVTVNAIADLRLDMVAPPLIAGLPSAYPIVVTNLSTIATSGVVTVTDVLPAGLEYAGFAGPGWTCAAAGPRVTCTLARPLNGRSISALAIAVRVRAARGTVITNTASVAPTDNVPSNNSATARSTVRR